MRPMPRRCSHVKASFTRVGNGARRYVREKGLAVALAERVSSYVHTCTHVYGHLPSAFTCSVNAVLKFSNRMPLIY